MAAHTGEAATIMLEADANGPKPRWEAPSQIARTAVTVARDGCYWAGNDLKEGQRRQNRS